MTKRELERLVAELQRSEVYWAEQFRTAKGAAERNEQDAARWRYLSERMTPTTTGSRAFAFVASSITPTGVEAWQLTEYILGDDLDDAIDKARGAK